MPILKYLGEHAVFEPDAIKAMSEALEQVCIAFHIDGHRYDREVIATRIIDLARNGVINAEELSNRVIAETKAMRSL